MSFPQHWFHQQQSNAMLTTSKRNFKRNIIKTANYCKSFLLFSVKLLSMKQHFLHRYFICWANYPMELWINKETITNWLRECDKEGVLSRDVFNQHYILKQKLTKTIKCVDQQHHSQKQDKLWLWWIYHLSHYGTGTLNINVIFICLCWPCHCYYLRLIFDSNSALKLPLFCKWMSVTHDVLSFSFCYHFVCSSLSGRYNQTRSETIFN